jgi:hypothetical protein
MGEDLTKHEIKDHVKRRKKEQTGRTIGVELLSGDRVVGVLEESRPNVLMVRDRADGLLKDIHRALVKRFLLIIDGGSDAK